MRSEELSQRVVDVLHDTKGSNITLLDVRTLTDVTDYMVVATGRSNRHVTALAGKIVQDAKSTGHAPLGVEGMRAGQWVLIDLCDVVVHVMQAEVREFYQLEKLWGGRDGDILASSQSPAH